jgi:hypothetical protein
MRDIVGIDRHFSRQRNVLVKLTWASDKHLDAVLFELLGCELDQLDLLAAFFRAGLGLLRFLSALGTGLCYFARGRGLHLRFLGWGTGILPLPKALKAACAEHERKQRNDDE